MHYQPQLSAASAEPPSAATASSTAAPAADSLPKAESPGKKRLLLIDDDPDAAYMLQESLNPQEYEVSAAHEGSEGLRLARLILPDAILLDIKMPGMDGWQVLHELKDDPATAHIPVICLTVVDQKTLGMRLGAAAYLLKPLDPGAVKAALVEVMR